MVSLYPGGEPWTKRSDVQILTASVFFFPTPALKINDSVAGRSADATAKSSGSAKR